MTYPNFFTIVSNGLEKAPYLGVSVDEYIEAYREKLKSVKAFKHVSIARLRVSKAEVVGDIIKYQKWSLANSGTTTKFICEYTCNNALPRTVHIRQCAGERCRKATAVFLPGGGKATLTVPFVIRKPEQVNFTAYGGFHRLFMRQLVRAVKTFGILNCSPKPVSEYPVNGVYNTTLTIIPEFKEGVSIYPKPTSYVDFKDMSLRVVQGAFRYKGKLYGIYDSNKCYTVLEGRYTVVANTDVVELEDWSTLLTVLYADKKHVSQSRVPASIANSNLREGESTSVSFRIPVPHWAYGYVNIASALNIYHNGMYVYGGGPMWSIMLCRGVVP